MISSQVNAKEVTTYGETNGEETVAQIQESGLRERTYSWEDPVKSAELGRKLSGLEYMQQLANGEIPAAPIAHTLGFKITSVEKGKVLFEIEPKEFHYNPIGSMHGGVISTVLDSVLGCTVHSTLAKGVGYTSLELKVSFIRPIFVKTGTVYAEAKVLAMGRTTAFAEGSLKDKRGRILATATTTCALFRS
ncbi:MAG: PaaI family thioesterase [Spirochaetota bacterium]